MVAITIVCGLAICWTGLRFLGKNVPRNFLRELWSRRNRVGGEYFLLCCGKNQVLIYSLTNYRELRRLVKPAHKSQGVPSTMSSRPVVQSQAGYGLSEVEGLPYGTVE